MPVNVSLCRFSTSIDKSLCVNDKVFGLIKKLGTNSLFISEDETEERRYLTEGECSHNLFSVNLETLNSLFISLRNYLEADIVCGMMLYSIGKSENGDIGVEFSVYSDDKYYKLTMIYTSSCEIPQMSVHCTDESYMAALYDAAMDNNSDIVRILSDDILKEIEDVVGHVLQELEKISFPVDIAEFTLLGKWSGGLDQVGVEFSKSELITGVSLITKGNGFLNKNYSYGGTAICFVGNSCLEG